MIFKFKLFEICLQNIVCNYLPKKFGYIYRFECKVSILFLLLQISRAHRRIITPIWQKIATTITETATLIDQFSVRPLRRQTVSLTEGFTI